MEQLRSIAKIKSEGITSINNSRHLPNTATIKKEYVRCGKLDCPSKHVPYYYAYLKKNRKTHKKHTVDIILQLRIKSGSSDMDMLLEIPQLILPTVRKTFEH